MDESETEDAESSGSTLRTGESLLAPLPEVDPVAAMIHGGHVESEGLNCGRGVSAGR